MSVLGIVVLLGIVPVFLGDTTTPTAGDSTTAVARRLVRDHLARLDLIDTRHGGITTLALSGRVIRREIEIHERIDSAGRHERTVCVRDTRDGTPVQMMDATATYCYDIRKQTLIRIEAPVPGMELRFRENELQGLLSWADDFIQIDPQFLLGRFEGEISTVAYPGTIALRRGNPLCRNIELVLDREGTEPLRGIIYQEPDTPAQHVDLVLNRELPAGWSPDRFARIFERSSVPVLRDPSTTRSRASWRASGAEFVNLQIRAGIYDETQRPQAERQVGTALNWAKLRAADRVFSDRKPSGKSEPR